MFSCPVLLDREAENTMAEIDKRMLYEMWKSMRESYDLSHVRKLAPIKDAELSMFTFVSVNGDYGIVSEDVPNNENIQIELTDGRTWRVPRTMVKYDFPPEHVQRDFKSLLPRSVNPNIVTKPSLAELRTMNPSQLSAVHDFEIVYKPSGSRIFFQGKTDLRGVDIDVIWFSDGVIEFYYETSPPLFNTKLNREAYVELRGCFPVDRYKDADITTLDRYRRCLERLCISHNARFISYKPEENGKLTFVFNGIR
jgi:Nucleoporin autopeptidase